MLTITLLFRSMKLFRFYATWHNWTIPFPMPLSVPRSEATASTLTGYRCHLPSNRRPRLSVTQFSSRQWNLLKLCLRLYLSYVQSLTSNGRAADRHELARRLWSLKREHTGRKKLTACALLTLRRFTIRKGMPIFMNVYHELSLLQNNLWPNK
jgi:hypothetical protein